MGAKTGRKVGDVLNDIREVVKGPVSAEGVGVDYETMMREARALSKLKPNIVVKIPLISEGLKAVKTCAAEGIHTNVTLVFSSNQALLAAKAGASLVSPFIGRIDDEGWEGMSLIEAIVQIYANYDFATEILVASVRHPVHVSQAAKLGADICTLPFKILKQMYHHPLTDSGIERFLKDWESRKQLAKA